MPVTSLASALVRLGRRVADAIDRSGVGPLLVRLILGAYFIRTGWTKLHHLGDVTEFFTSLGIPAPGFQARVVACTEFLGGSLLVVGLVARLAAAPLACTMLVALATAKRGDIEGFDSLLGMQEFLLLLLFVWLACAGAGRLSVDYYLGKLWRRPAAA
jgi:putative oxidoreductase